MTIDLDEISNQISTAVSDELASQLKTVPKIVEAAFKAVIYDLIGVSKSGSTKYEIPYHTRSPVMKCVNALVETTINDKIAPLVKHRIDSLISSQKFMENLTSSVDRMFAERFRDEYNNALRKATSDTVSKMTGKVSSLIESRIKELTTINTDISDPSSYGGKLGTELLRYVADDLLKKPEEAEDADD